MEAFKNIKLTFDCPKTLDELTPCDGGWDCSSCRKMVHDFRGMTETEILNIFAKSGTPLCGVYDAGRFVVPVKKPKWQKWLSAAMIMLGMSAFSKMAFAQQPDVTNKVPLDTMKSDSAIMIRLGGGVPITMVNPPDYDKLRRYIYKRINYNGPFAGTAQVSFKVEEDGTLTDIAMANNSEKELDEKIVAIVKRAPKWRKPLPGARTYYTIDIDIPRKRK